MAEQLIDIKQLPAALLAEVRGKGADVVRAMRTAAERSQGHIATVTTEDVENTSGIFSAGWRVTYTDDGAILHNVVPYAEFVEHGRRPGTPPPVYPIFRWLADKRGVRGQGLLAVRQPRGRIIQVVKGPRKQAIRYEGRYDLGDQAPFSERTKNGKRLTKEAHELEELRKLAVVISRSIGAKGTRPKRYVAKAQPDFRRIMEEEARKAVAG